MRKNLLIGDIAASARILLNFLFKFPAVEKRTVWSIYKRVIRANIRLDNNLDYADYAVFKFTFLFSFVLPILYLVSFFSKEVISFFPFDIFVPSGTETMAFAFKYGLNSLFYAFVLVIPYCKQIVIYNNSNSYDFPVYSRDSKDLTNDSVGKPNHVLYFKVISLLTFLLAGAPVTLIYWFNLNGLISYDKIFFATLPITLVCTALCTYFIFLAYMGLRQKKHYYKIWKGELHGL